MATPTYVKNRRLGEEFWNQELKKYTGINSGAIQPQELPEFRNMYQALMQVGNQQLQNLYKNAVARGIQGGALEQLMQQAQENMNKGALSWIQNMFQVANQRGGQASTGAQNWWMQRQQLSQQLKAQRDRQHFLKQMGWAQFGLDATKMGAGAAAGAMAGGMTEMPTTPTSGSSPGFTAPGATTGYGSAGSLNAPWLNYDWSSYKP